MSPAQTAAELAQRFPALFGGDGPPKPLKLRIQADIQQRAPGVFTRKTLSPFLHRHTTSTPYLKALVASADRFDLDGQPAGVVADEHRQAAQVELERRRALVAARRAAMAPGPRGPGPGGDRRAPGGAPDARGPRGPRSDRPARPDRRAQGPNRPGGERPDQAPGPRDQRPEHQRDAGPSAGADGTQPPRAPHRPKQPDQPRRAERAERAARPVLPGRHDGSAGPARPGRQGWPDRPHRAGPPQRPARSDAPADDHAPRHEADPARRERATLLRQWESSPLTKANFCALKRLGEAELDAALALARQERGAVVG
jgi:sRNA-binding protein